MQEHGKISFWSAVLMSINIIVGAGIFVGPQKLVAATGSLGFLAYLIAGILFLPIAWGVAQASQLFPGSGGLYNYAKQGLGNFAGFITHCLYVLGYLGTVAAVTAFLHGTCVTTFGSQTLAHHVNLFNAAIITFFCLLNLLSVSTISKIQSSVTLLKLLPIIVVVTIFAWYWSPTISYPLENLPKISPILSMAIFSFWGFESCCSISHYLADGPEKVGKVILTAFSIVTILNMLFCLGVTHIMGVDALAAQGAPAFPSYLGLPQGLTALLLVGVTACILISLLNTLFGVIFGNVTNIHMLAEKNLIVGAQTLSKTTASGRPWVVTLITGIIVWLLLYVVNQDTSLAALTNFGVTLAFTMTLLAVFAAQYRTKKFAALITTVVGLASCCALMYYSWAGLGATFTDKATNIAPLILAIIACLILYAFRQKGSAIA